MTPTQGQIIRVYGVLPLAMVNCLRFKLLWTVSQFNKSKDVRSHDQTNTIVKMKNKRNLFNYQLAWNIKTQSEEVRCISQKKKKDLFQSFFIDVSF